MERRLKERLTGAAVLIMLAVIFIPMVLDNSSELDNRITETNIPPRPDTDFRSRIMSPQDIPDTTGTQEVLESPRSESRDDTSAGISTAGNTQTTTVPGTTAGNSSPETVPEPVADSGNDDTGDADAWVVQLGSFSSQSNANSLVSNLQGQGYRAYIEEIKGDSGIIYRVRVGPELSRTEAEKTQAGLAEQFKLQGMILRYP